MPYLNHIQRHQEEGDEISMIVKQIKSNKPIQCEHFMHIKDKLIVQNGILFMKEELRCLSVVPVSGSITFLSNTQLDKITGHITVDPLMKRIAIFAYVYDLSHIAQAVVDSCLT